jgi:pimeloyl-ACP methyl ester carboxylesterase
MAGNSLGGRITWQYAASHQQQVRKAILIDAAGYPQNKRPFIFRMAKIKPVASIFRYCTSRFLIKFNLRQVYSDESKITDSLVERYFKLSLREGNRPAFISTVNQFQDADTSVISQLKIPVLIEWGVDDMWIPFKSAEKFNRDIPGSKLIFYPHAGHVPMEELPAETVKDAIQFLQPRMLIENGNRILIGN